VRDFNGATYGSCNCCGLGKGSERGGNNGRGYGHVSLEMVMSIPPQLVVAPLKEATVSKVDRAI
jgi:hypothetical protein